MAEVENCGGFDRETNYQCSIALLQIMPHWIDDSIRM
jgi:hypothetical protein